MFELLWTVMVAGSFLFDSSVAIREASFFMCLRQQLSVINSKSDLIIFIKPTVNRLKKKRILSKKVNKPKPKLQTYLKTALTRK